MSTCRNLGTKLQMRLDIRYTYICPHCGGFAEPFFWATEVFDSGTTLTCDKCGGKTVMLLLTQEDYAKMEKEKWGRRYRVTHLWYKVATYQWRSRCGQIVPLFEPDGDSAEPRCIKCAKSAAIRTPGEAQMKLLEVNVVQD